MKKGVFQAFLIRGRRTIPHGLSSKIPKGFNVYKKHRINLEMRPQNGHTGKILLRSSSIGRRKKTGQVYCWGKKQAQFSSVKLFAFAHSIQS
ncbi:MAG: hypothetical protein CRN43_13535, partial [Candidatus Nephrothrix sp. EaCA]